MADVPVSIEDVLAARKRIGSAIHMTPCYENPLLSALVDMQIFCKYENLQRTGSFKERGARNALMLMDDKSRAKGVVTASTGSHALGLSYHARELGVPVTVVMSEASPALKRNLCKYLGAKVIVSGSSYNEALEKAILLAERDGKTFVPAADDPKIIAGQGTMALEILEQVDHFDVIVVAIGAGGFLAGMVTVLKSLRPQVKIIGVEPENAASWAAAVSAGEPVTIDVQPTIADGLAVKRAGTHTFATVRDRIDGLVTVSEQELKLAMFRIAERAKCVVEGAGAAAFAACLSGKLSFLHGKRVVIPLCGGNIEPSKLAGVFEAVSLSIRHTGKSNG